MSGGETDAAGTKPREARRTALLIIDMVSCWDFPDAEALLPFAAVIAKPIARLKKVCAENDVPTIYCNDNRGRWRSDFRTLVESSLAGGDQGAEITTRLRPSTDDYFVLKPMQSAFFETALGSLLKHLEVHRLILTGVASDQCIMASAMEAGMRGFGVVIPPDAVASQTQRRNEVALDQFRDTHKLEVVPVSRLVQSLSLKAE